MKPESRAGFHSRQGAFVSTFSPTGVGWAVVCLYLALNLASIFWVTDHRRLLATVIVNIAYILVVMFKSDGTLLKQNIGFFLSMLGTSMLFIGSAIPDGFRLFKVALSVLALILFVLSVLGYARPRA